MLIDEGHLHGRSDHDLAAVGLFAAGDQLEQRGLARAVRPDDAEDRARGDVEAQVVYEQAVAERLAHVLELDHLAAQALGHGDEDFLRLVALLVFVVGQFFEACDTRLALGLAPFGVLAHPFELFLHGFGARVLGALFLLEPGLALLQPGRIIALVRDAVAAIELQDPLGRVVEEVAVVRDRHHGARKAFEEHFEPLHALGVEVVGGLVEQQHVGLGQQQAAQCDAALFAARELADFRVPRRQAQSVGGDLELVLGIRACGGDDGLEARLLGGKGVEIGLGVGIRGIDFIELGARGKDLAHRFFDALAHGVLGVELRLLRQVADLQARHGQGLALEFFVHAGHDLEQGGLARTVQTQHADLGAGEKAQGNVFENLSLRGYRLADMIHRIYVLGHGINLTR